MEEFDHRVVDDTGTHIDIDFVEIHIDIGFIINIQDHFIFVIVITI